MHVLALSRVASLVWQLHILYKKTSVRAQRILNPSKILLLSEPIVACLIYYKCLQEKKTFFSLYLFPCPSTKPSDVVQGRLGKTFTREKLPLRQQSIEESDKPSSSRRKGGCSVFQTTEQTWGIVLKPFVRNAIFFLLPSS